MPTVLFDCDVLFDGHGHSHAGVRDALAAVNRWRDACGRPVRAAALRRGALPPPAADTGIYVGRSAERCAAAERLGWKPLQLDTVASDAVQAALPDLRKWLDVARSKPTPRELDEQIKKAVASVCATCIARDIEALVALDSRKAGSDGAEKAADYLEGRFLELGYPAADVHTQEFDCIGCFPPHKKNRNVLCGQPKPVGLRRVVLIGGHYDSTSSRDDPAPGADDNASGIAATLELARVLRGSTLSFRTVFAAFGAEEKGQQGSKRCAELACEEQWPLDLVINLDQIGFRGDDDNSRFVFIEHDNRNPPHGNDLASLAFATVMMGAARAYADLEPELAGLDVSDHRSFERKGFTCVGVSEGVRNGNAHKKEDLKASVEYVANVTKMVLATILTLGAEA